MNIQLLSDLHLESNPHFVARPVPGADLLVLAGDIGSYQPGSLLTDLLHDSDFGLARFFTAAGGARRGGLADTGAFLPGNHEYDGLDFPATHARLREVCQRLGLIWLEREVLEIGGVRFIGSTLWTDFDALAPGPDADPAQALAAQLKAREKAFRAANFYLRKNHSLQHGVPMLAGEVRELGLQSQAWLRQALARPFAGPTVVVTHFAPSLRSADPRYGLAPGTAGFCNALDDLLAQAQLWLHGHLHCPSDYVHNGCRVVANPLGYARKGEQQGFLPDLLIKTGPSLC